MTATRRGLLFSLSERYVLIAISLASSMLLARLLTPEEIGIYSVSLAVIGIAQVVRDFGIGNFLIQERQLTEAHIRTAFGFSLLIGSALFVIVFLAAPFVGQFYDEKRLVETMRISALNFLVLPFCSISLSLLRRDMLFKRLAAVGVAAAFTGFSVGVSLAYAGHGPNSMALGAVASNIVTGALAWLARTDRKLLLPSLSEWRVILKFGSQSSAANVVTTISMDINDLALGRILGFAPVAMISRAQGVARIFSQEIMAAIHQVMYPAFAKAHRDGESVDAQYIRSVTTVTVVAWPFYGMASLYAHELIRLMFGPQWDEAANLVPIFCLAGVFSATTNLLLPAVMAVGRIDLFVRAELTIQPLRALLIVSAAMTFQSLEACAFAFLAVSVVSTPFLYWIKSKCLPTDYVALRRGLLASAKLAVFTLALPALLLTQISTPPDFGGSALLLAGAATLAAASWLVGLYLFDHPLKGDPLMERVFRLFSRT
jgi:O-antigen/teichoic acid export membrane protein